MDCPMMLTPFPPFLTGHFANGKPEVFQSFPPAPVQTYLYGVPEFYLVRRKRKRARYKQAGRGGMGTVFEDKGIKALVVRWDTVSLWTNNPADKAALKKVAKSYSREIVELDPKQNEMAKSGPPIS